MRPWAALCLALLLAAAAAIAWRGGPGYATQDRATAFSEASHAHPAGTDALGRDRLVRVAVASLLGLAGAACASALTTALAGAIGILAAFAPSALSTILLLVCDAFLALPWLFLLMMVRSGLSLTLSPLRSAAITFLILGLLGWPACARAVHSGAGAIRSADWLLHGRAAGLRTTQLVRSHLLPHLVPLLLPQFLLCVPAYTMAEANLGTLGLGVGEPLPSWGSMLLEIDSSAALAHTYWICFPLCLLVSLLVCLELLTNEVHA